MTKGSALRHYRGGRGTPEGIGGKKHFGCYRHSKTEKGHTRVPAIHSEDGFRLGEWVKGQRAMWKRDDLAVGRSDRLESLPGWTWDARTERGPDSLS
jgi:hypothetical protein